MKVKYRQQSGFDLLVLLTFMECLSNDIAPINSIEARKLASDYANRYGDDLLVSQWLEAVDYESKIFKETEDKKSQLNFYRDAFEIRALLDDNMNSKKKKLLDGEWFNAGHQLPQLRVKTYIQNRSILEMLVLGMPVRA